MKKILLLIPIFLIAVLALAADTQIFTNYNFNKNNIYNLTWSNSTNMNATNICLGGVCIAVWPLGTGVNFWQVSGSWMWPNTTVGGQNNINLTTVNATNFYGNLNASYVQNAPWITTWTPNTTAQMQGAVNNSGYYNITSQQTYYMNNATERSAFTSTYNISYYLTSNPFNFYNSTNLPYASNANVSTTTCTAGQLVSAINNATGVVSCTADLFNTSAQMVTAINTTSYYQHSVNDSAYLNHKAEANLNVNSSVYWNGINAFSGLNYNVLSYFANITDIANCTAAQKVLGKVSGAWVCSTDLFNTSTDINNVINGTANAYYQLKTNESAYLNGKASSYYLNTGGGITFGNITDIANCSAGSYVNGKVGSAWVCAVDTVYGGSGVNFWQTDSSAWMWANTTAGGYNSINITTLNATTLRQGGNKVLDISGGITFSNITDITNCTIGSQFVQGKVGSAWICGNDLLNTSAQMITAINTTSYYQHNVNSSLYWNGISTFAGLNNNVLVNGANITSGTITSTQLTSSLNLGVGNISAGVFPNAMYFSTALPTSNLTGIANSSLASTFQISGGNVSGGTLTSTNINGAVWVNSSTGGHYNDNTKIYFGTSNNFCIYYNTTLAALVSTNVC